MKFLVLGRGFAAYGYTPALVYLGHEVYVPEKLYQRLRIYQFVNPEDYYRVKIFDCRDKSFDAIVLALRPFEITKNFSKLESLITPKTHIYFEKPVSEDPLQGLELFRRSEHLGAKFTVNYSFLWTPWYQKVQHKIERANHVVCKWDFIARFNVDRENWKSLHSQGGGALLFYAIHFLSLVPLSREVEVLGASLTTTTVGDSRVNCLLSLSKEDTSQRSIFEIHLDFKSKKTQFSITTDGVEAYTSDDPFLNPNLDPTIKNSSLDRRFSNLKKYIISSQDIKHYELMNQKAMQTQKMLIKVVTQLSKKHLN
jgi:hypothetical protein